MTPALSVTPFAAATPLQWRVRMSEGLLIRVGGLPFAAVDALSRPEVGAALRQARELEARLHALGQLVTDALFERIHAVREDNAQRVALLSLKRNVHNGRNVAASRRQCAASLTPALEVHLDAWQTVFEAIGQHAAASTALVEDQIAAGRRHLQSLATLPDFRAGLLTSSPAFERSLAGLLRWREGKLDRKVRHVEEALLAFLYRTTHKTSPFSRLTLVCFGTLAAGTALAPYIDHGRITTVVRPNLSLLARVRHLLTANAVAFPTLELTLPAGAERGASHVHFRRRVETLLDGATTVHAMMREFAYSLRITRSLARLLDRFDEGTATVAELMSLLAADGMSREAAADYLNLLAEKGLLRPAGLDLSVLDPDCWRRFAERINATGDDRLAAVGQAITRLVEDSARYGDAGLAERHALFDALGAQWDAAVAAIQPGGNAPRPLLYEDATLTAVPLALGRDGWAPVVEHIPAVQRFLSLFDPLLPSRLSMRAIFVRTYGAGGQCDDIAGFSDLFHDRFFSAFMTHGPLGRNRFGSGRLNPRFVPELNKVDRAKQRVLQLVAELRAAATPFEIVLPDPLVADLGEIGAAEQPYLANAFYLQIAALEGRHGAVLNKVYGGAGSAFSRFDPLFGTVDARPLATLLRDTLAARDGGGRLHAEFQAGYYTNLNQHVPLTATEIVLPGERGVAPPERQVALAELSLRHDPQEDRLYLYCARLGVEIVPIYAGMFYPLAMPELQTLLMHFSCPVSLEGEFFPPPDEDGAETPGFHPRIRYRNVVLERACWIVDVADTITREAGETDYGFLARWDAWRIARELPARCYVKVFAAAAAHGADRAQQKPFFVDFASAFCIAQLEKSLRRRTGRVHFTEALPDTDDAIVTVDGNSRVAECVVEFSQERA